MRKKMLGGSIILLAIVFLLMSCSTNRYRGVVAKEGEIERGRTVAVHAQDVGEISGDATISLAIRVKFANDKIVSRSDINVDTTGGHVTLSGAVPGQAEAARAMRLGRSVDGVKSVRSNLVVRSEGK